MADELKRDKIERLAKEDPFLTIEKIANLANTTTRYVRTVLYEKGISLQELRRVYANSWKMKSNCNPNLDDINNILAPIARDTIKSVDLVHIASNNTNIVKEGLFVTNKMISHEVNQSYQAFQSYSQTIKISREWVEVINNLYLVKWQLYNVTKEEQLLFYYLGLGEEVRIVNSPQGLQFESKFIYNDSQKGRTEKDSLYKERKVISDR